MKRYMLDTNTISHLLRHHPAVTTNVQKEPMASLCMSAITYAEIAYGMAKRPDATKLRRLVTELCKRIDTLTFTIHSATVYGELRAVAEAQGKSLSQMDMLIATHAHSLNLTLISNDQAFQQIPNLVVEDWTIPPSHEASTD